MEFEALQVGLVVQADWDGRPFRILAFDRTEVLYDCWWPDVGRWGLQDLLGKTYYYRTATRLILERAAALRVDSLTGDEHSVHRPDLPLRLLRFSELEWSNNLFTSSIDAFSSRVASAAPNISVSNSDVALDVGVVALPSYGSKGGMKTPFSSQPRTADTSRRENSCGVPPASKLQSIAIFGMEWAYIGWGSLPDGRSSICGVSMIRQASLHAVAWNESDVPAQQAATPAHRSELPQIAAGVVRQDPYLPKLRGSPFLKVHGLDATRLKCPRRMRVTRLIRNNLRRNRRYACPKLSG